MKRLKELRAAKGLTQAELAKRIGTTQQTVARWESGKSAPAVAALDGLAYALGTTIAHLLGQRSSEQVTDEEDDDSGIFWGHLGLLLSSWRHTEWYPISEKTRQRLWSALRNLDVDDKDNEWIVCETLNNRMVAFRPDVIDRVWLLDDACDGPEGDWNSKFPLDDYSGHPPAIYRAMDEWMNGAWGIEEGDAESKIRQEIVEKLLKAARLDDPDKLNKFLHYTKVYTLAGRFMELWVEPNDLWFAISDLEFGFNRCVYLPGFGGDHESFFPLRNLAIIDAPLLDVDEGRQDELRELTEATDRK